MPLVYWGLNDLTLIVDGQITFEPLKPAGSSMPSVVNIVEWFVLMYALVMTNDQLGGVNEGESCATTRAVRRNKEDHRQGS